MAAMTVASSYRLRLDFVTLGGQFKAHQRRLRRECELCCLLGSSLPMAANAANIRGASPFTNMGFLQAEARWIPVLDAGPYAESLDRGKESLATLPEWLELLRLQHAPLDAMILAHGGLLLRGLPVNSAGEFEAVAAEFLPVQERYIGGVSRRSRVHNNVYNTTEAPGSVVIEQHLEATHTPLPPERIVFNCQIAPQHGGETPLASFVQLHDALPADVTRPLEGERVLYTRELMDRESRLYRLLPKKVTQSLALSWQEVSGCDDLQDARNVLERGGYEVSLRGVRRFRTRCCQPVISEHPDTGRKCWYLSDQITRPLPWHARLARRALRSRLGMEFALESGRQFAPGVLDLVHRTIARIRFSFTWQQGDVLVLDNHQMSHGRNIFSGERLILTAFG